MDTATYGFHSVHEEYHDRALQVEGTVPTWLEGSLLRAGPGEFEPAGTAVDHWFDGLAMIYRYAFHEGTVRYSNRFLRSTVYRNAKTNGVVGGFATGGGGLISRIRSLVGSTGYDNANIIVERLGDHYYALTETSSRVAIDPVSLQPIDGKREFGADSRGHLSCAHVHHDPWTGTAVTFETKFGRRHRYILSEEDNRGRTTIATISVDQPAYMHSFALTREFVVLTEFPLRIYPIEFFKPGTRSFVDVCRWEPDRGTRVRLIDRESGTEVNRFHIAPLFGFHHVNAYQRGDEVIMDLETIPDGLEAIEALNLDRLRAGELEVPAGKIERITLNHTADTIGVSEIHGGGTALPTIAPGRRCRRHRFVYAQGLNQPADDWPRAVRKVDVETGRYTEFSPGESYLGEPIFVGRPDAGRSDDGVVLTVGLDPGSGRSSLYLLEAGDLSRLAKAELPHAIPFDFHGRYYRNL